MCRPIKISLFYFLLLVVSPGWGQSDSSLPKLLPSYSENFKDFKSFISLCVEDAYTDHSGRLWLQTCGSGKLNRIHLFQFDGYDFKVAKGGAEELPTYIRIFLMTPDNQLVGGKKEEGVSKVFFLDMGSSQIKEYGFPEEGVAEYLFLDKSNQIVVYYRTEDSWVRYHLQDHQFVEHARMKIPDDIVHLPEHEVIYATEDEAWVFPGRSDNIIKIDVGKNQLVRYKEELFDFPAGQEKEFDVSDAIFKEVGGDLYLECWLHISKPCPF